MKKLLFLLFFILLTSLGIILIPASKAQDAMCSNPANLSYEDLGKCVDELNTARQQSVNATIPLETQINAIQQRIAFIEQDIVVKKKDINDGYANLAKQQQILNATIRDYYIKSYYNSPLLILLSANSASQFTQILGYQKANADRDKAIITNIAITINDLKNQKIALENEETSIATIKNKLAVIVNGAKAYQATLSNQISQLSALQQQILAQRLSSLNIPLYAGTGGGCSSDIGKDPGFGNKFGFFTYGVPNRVGLNQYGAYGRANANQNADTILHAYYNFDGYQNINNVNINVNDGNGVNTGNVIWSGSLEDYVKRIYEVPDGWPSEALKAQAIAVRSYVLAATNNGANSICANQNCQVFKTDPKGGNWDQAVNDTSGQVMVQGGQPIKAWFSSTHGGYVHSSGDIGWSDTSFTKNAQDTSGSVNNFSDLNNNAYDKSSPWFYCDWGSRSSSNNTAWLQSNEVADIVNVILLLEKDSSVANHLYQTDKPNLAGTDTWDAGRVRQELQNRGITPYNNIDSVSISADFGSGKVSNVSVSGDAGSNSFSGSDFKNYFNLRAPANIQIVGPLYNVER
jgi:peptidoglycan hydrolase-like amidase/peptidoglycan hydrolase CwlO-like protein